jgi:preflagellin peptidase FlaK
MNPSIDVMRVIFGLAFLFYASYTDLKTRRVKNEVWILMGFCGGILIALEAILDRWALEYLLFLIPIGILFGSMFYDFGNNEKRQKKGINFLPILLFVVGLLVMILLFFRLSGETRFYQLLTIPLLILFFFVLYQAGMLHGGADAKAMMAIAILVPFYPYFSEFPLLQFASGRVADAMELFFPFAFLVLMNSVFFVVWVFLGFLVFNGTKKDLGFPEMLLGYKMDIDEVENKFVWPMERIVDGERVLVLFPRKIEKDNLDKLREMDVKRIWVTPKIPFIVFITAGFAISIFLGNVFAAMMGLLG